MGAWNLGREAAIAAAPASELRNATDMKVAYAYNAQAEAGEQSDSDASKDTLKMIGKLLDWIPAEVVVLYGVALSLLAQTGNRTALILTIIGLPISALFVFGSAWATAKSKWWSKQTKGRMFLAPVAFVIWSLTVPGSGWDEIGWIKDNPEWTAAIALGLAAVFSIIALGLDNRWSKKSGSAPKEQPVPKSKTPKPA